VTNLMKLTRLDRLALLAAVTLVACAAPSKDALAPGFPVSGAETVAPTVFPVQAPTAAVTPTPTLKRLTEPGCCTQPIWSADSTQVRFIDRPASSQQVGLYAVSLDGGPPTLVSERLGELSPDDRYLAYPEEGETYVEVLSTGQRWAIDNEGHRVIFSPGSTRLAWERTLSSGGGYDEHVGEIYVTSPNGTVKMGPFTLYGGGGFSGWLDDEHLLVVGKLEPEGERALYNLSLMDGATVELARGERVRSGIPAPGGAWVAYIVLLDQEEPANNGIWIVSADGQHRFKLDLFGAFQWRDADRLLVVPQDVGAPSHRLVEIDASTGQTIPLTDPLVTPFVIEGGDWRVSPDGRHVVFVSAADRAIWLLTLP
jgi:hypothetical protein